MPSTTWIGGARIDIAGNTSGNPADLTNPFNWTNGLPDGTSQVIFTYDVSQLIGYDTNNNPIYHFGPWNAPTVFSGQNITLVNAVFEASWGGLGVSISDLGTLTLQGQSRLNAGEFSTPMSATALINTGTLSIGGTTRIGHGLTLSNSGTVVVESTGNLVTNTIINDAGALVNQSGGLVDFRGDGGLVSGLGSFTNIGTLRRSVGTGTASITCGFNDVSAPIDVQTGTLSFQPGFNQSAVLDGASFSVAGGAVADFPVGAGFTGTVTGTGAGRVQFAGGFLATPIATVDFVDGLLHWSGGTMTKNGGNFINNGFLTVDGTTRFGAGLTVANFGTFVISENANFVTSTLANDAGTFSNQGSGVVELLGDGSVSGLGAFQNLGTLRKPTGTGTSFISSNYSDLTGKIDVTAGAISFSPAAFIGLPALTGTTMTVAAGSSVTFPAGANSIGTIAGTGGGLVTWNGGTFPLGGADFSFAPGLLHWSGGTFSGLSAVATNFGSITIDGEVRIAGGMRLTNAGKINIFGGGSLITNDTGNSGGSILNNLGGVIDMQGTGDITGLGGFTNHGILRRSSLSASSSVSCPFTSDGLIDVVSGQLVVNGGRLSGTAQAVAGASLAVNSATFFGTFFGFGAGRVDLVGGVYSVEAPGATLNVAGPMLNWVGGQWSAGYTTSVINAGRITLPSDTAVRFTGNFVNQGEFVVTGTGGLIFSDVANNGGGLTNQSGGVIDLQGNAVFTGLGSLNNQGTIRRSTGTGLFDINLYYGFSNPGTVEVLSGALNLAGPVSQVVGNTLTGGSWTVAGYGSLALTAAITSNQATVTILGSDASFPNLSPLSSNSGTLNLLNGVTFQTLGSVTNDGVLVLGAGSVLTVPGTATQGAMGRLTFQLGGIPASSQFGRLNVTNGGTAMLAGTLSAELVNSFVPAPGDTFPVMAFGAKAGGFTTTSLPTLPGGSVMLPEYSATALNLLVGAEPTITSTAGTTFTEGFFGEFTVTTTGSPTPSLMANGALPSGVTFTDLGNGTATIAGTPGAGTSGLYTLSITVGNGVGMGAMQSFPLHVVAAPVITIKPDTLPNLNVNQSLEQRLTAAGGATPYQFLVTAGDLPTGLFLTTDGVLKGQAQAAGTFTFTVTATDSSKIPGGPFHVDQQYTINVSPVVMPGSVTIVAGAGEGGGPHVRVFNADGSVRLSFFAYDAAFRGGVHVASADITGDGIDDIITGPGAGGGPHVRVFDGTTGKLVREFFAYNAGFFGGVFVAGADVDGDGRADIVTGAGASGGPHVKVFSGATGLELRSFFAYAAGFAGGVTVAAGDVDGDGKADIITGAGPGGGPHVEVFSGKNGAMLRSFFAYSASFTGGVSVAAGDVDGDGKSDVIAGAMTRGGPHVEAFSGVTGSRIASFLVYDPVFTGGVNVAAADLNNDGRADFITGAGPGGGSHVRTFDAANGEEMTSFLAFDAAFLGGVFVG
ncbi:MAG: FG-GAP-like repeat-containing protein [Gemmataceae bacterium]|nr:FG-GAP-like repeat-containing protein [Gemmataceae bacterium]